MRNPIRYVKNFLNIDLKYLKKELPVLVFVVIALVSGLVFMKNVGTLVGPDMYTAHYKATLATATGQMFTKPIDIQYGKRQLIEGSEKYFSSGGAGCADGGGFVSLVIDDPLKSDGKNGCVKAHDQNLSNKVVQTDAILQYPFIGYIPQGVGMFIGMKTGLEPVYAQTLARFFNLIAYIVIIVISIKIIPKGKWFFVLVASLPASLFLASSLSADSLNIALSFLFVAYMGRLYLQKERINNKQIILLAVLGIGFFVLKVAYTPFLLLLFALKKEVMSTRLKWLLFLGIVVIGGLLYGVWSAKWGALSAMVDPATNMSTIIHNFPKAFIGILMNIFYIPMELFNLSGTLYITTAVLIGALMLSRIKTAKVVQPTRLYNFIYLYRLQILGLLVAIASLGLTYGALLLTWTNIGIDGYMNIQGFQGRYVLPLLPLLVLVYFIPQKKSKKNNPELS